jgi:predicted esterase
LIREPSWCGFFSQSQSVGFIVALRTTHETVRPPVMAAMEAVWIDTHERLVVDAVRVYATGMSGGTLPALILATNQGAGIIACAGALDPSQVPKTERRLDWMGSAGESDFNFSLTRSVVEAMVQRGAVARFASFEGGHSWPPETLAARALEWLELRLAHRTAVTRRCSIDRLYAQGLARVRDAGSGRRTTLRKRTRPWRGSSWPAGRTGLGPNAAPARLGERARKREEAGGP